MKVLKNPIPVAGWYEIFGQNPIPVPAGMNFGNKHPIPASILKSGYPPVTG